MDFERKDVCALSNNGGVVEAYRVEGSDKVGDVFKIQLFPGQNGKGGCAVFKSRQTIEALRDALNAALSVK